jgi:hypothetical protein
MNNQNVVYISSGSKVYRSDDKGATWTNVTYNLPNVNIIRIIHDVHSTDESVYVGSAKGVYYKNDTMTSWLNYSYGLPTIADITDFMIYNDGTAASVLRVSYYGRGVWETPLNTLPVLVSEAFSLTDILSVYPNPAKDNVEISFNAGNRNRDFLLEIKNLIGQIVYSEKINSFSGNYYKNIDISNFTNGMYIILLSDENQTVGKKVLIY